MPVLIGLQDHHSATQRTSHLNLLPICVVPREHLLEEIRLVTVLGNDICRLLGPSHGDIEQPAFLIDLTVLSAQEHRDDHRFLPDAGESISSGLVVDGEHYIRLETFG